MRLLRLSASRKVANAARCRPPPIAVSTLSTCVAVGFQPGC
jgi:hypothetical protein